MRQIVEKDYLELCKWWESWGWEPIPEVFLSPRGLIIDGVCAAWLYETNVPICWVENFISNKDASKKDRDEGLDLIISEFNKMGKDLGFLVSMSAVKHNGLMRRLEKHGYNKTDSGMTHFIRRL